MTTREASQKRLTLNLNLDRLDILVLGVLSGLFLGAVGASLYFHFRTSLPDLADWLDSVLQNTGTEMFGAVLTFYLIEVMLRKRREQDAERRAIEQEKQRLLLQLGSPDNAFAVEAARILEARGWGFREDTTLRGTYLAWANLQRANLENVNLREANLSFANLQGVNLQNANLQGVRLANANLQSAFLVKVNLREVNLEDANLQGANLHRANLRGVDFKEANLQGAELDSADLQGAILMLVEFDEETILPNGSNWTPDADLTRFTDPDHPDFWRSDDRNSPAYRGKKDD